MNGLFIIPDQAYAEDAARRSRMAFRNISAYHRAGRYQAAANARARGRAYVETYRLFRKPRGLPLP